MILEFKRCYQASEDKQKDNNNLARQNLVLLVLQQFLGIIARWAKINKWDRLCLMEISWARWDQVMEDRIRQFMRNHNMILIRRTEIHKSIIAAGSEQALQMELLALLDKPNYST